MGSSSSSFRDEKKFLLEREVNEYFVKGIKYWDADRFARLKRIMEGDVTFDVEVSERDSFAYVDQKLFLNQFENFLQLYPSWRENNVILFWMTYPKANHEKMLVMRKQLSGLCFMHAPVVLQHYLLCIYRISIGEDLDFKMIDVANYIKQNWKGSTLETYIAYDHGGSSLQFFKDINNPLHITYRRYILNNPRHHVAFTKVCSEIMEELRSYPALVSNFKVSPKFQASGTSFAGVQNLSSNNVGLHAMLLIGGRQAADGQFYFLLQNWWQDRFFIEVSAEYLYSSEATISFVEEEIKSIPETFTCTNSPYSETTADACERMDELLVSNHGGRF
mmetsp:Transcript_22727/g.32644  ORF Transcript_22727/g.32644 Transcript_22727/m.32644 type:complete len:333 (-) Transcript_22727:181-1179(-)|eukprot:CAMPEP_0170073674 /NCGR_PEP_ID=MMETSP0019_2-20121128/11054_1 /TAXON_ID=98059 /ORGANISM="Dinobryon sp., Strain UTEXLB2267" /LENGTH=332 /DNA_ID=CAMNT_0010283365 /DNA_START=71 /DNA_END=1069 /DNA_ORIENTATION=+